MDDRVHILGPLLADVLRYHDIDANRQSHEQIDKQADQNGIAADCRQSACLRETARYCHILRIEQLLQDTARCNGERKHQ